MDVEDRGRIKNKLKGREGNEMEWKSFRVKRGIEGRCWESEEPQVDTGTGEWMLGAEGGGSVQGQE